MMHTSNLNSNYLASIELDATKIRKKDLHLLTDIVELVCLKNSDHQISLEEALDEQLGENEGIGGIIDTDPILYDLMSPDKSEKNDNTENQRLDILNHLLARVLLFKNNYPFQIDKSGFINLKDEVNLWHKYYVLMLLSSHLGFIPKIDRNKFASDFEILGALALKCILPKWIVKIFGTAKCDSLQSYSGTPKDKIEQFTRETGLKNKIPLSELSRYNTPNGDAGLDVVAWHPFDDGATHMPIFLAQIGCTADESQMFSKQYTVCPSRWENKLSGLAAIGCMITPQCYRDARNAWPSPTDVNSVFIDRSRVLNLLTTVPDSQFSPLQMMSVVESTLI